MIDAGPEIIAERLAQLTETILRFIGTITVLEFMAKNPGKLPTPVDAPGITKTGFDNFPTIGRHACKTPEESVAQVKIMCQDVIKFLGT